MWTFRNMNTRIVNISKSTPLRDGTTHFWSFAPWKRDSWASFNLPSCRLALFTSERFEASKRDSWEVANRQPFGRHYPYLNDSQPENAITEHQPIKFLAKRHCPLLNDSQPEYAIPDYQQINLISGQQDPYLNVAHPEMRFPSISKSALLQDGLTHIRTFRSLKTGFLRKTNHSPYRMVLPIFVRFAAWKRPYMSITKSKAFRVSNAHISIFKRFLRFRKLTPVQFGTAHI